MAMISPKLMPSKSFWGIFSSVVVVSRCRSPRVMFSTRARFGSIVMTSPPSRGRPTSSPRESRSRVAVYRPSPGRMIVARPSSSVSTSSTSSSDASVTTITAPSTGSSSSRSWVPLRSTTTTEISRSSPEGSCAPAGARPLRSPTVTTASPTSSGKKRRTGVKGPDDTSCCVAAWLPRAHSRPTAARTSPSGATRPV